LIKRPRDFVRFIRCQPVVLRPAFLERGGRSAVHPIRNQILRSILKYIENRGSTRRVKRKIGVDCSVPESVSRFGLRFYVLAFAF
jgi:hypothetical protein